MPVKRRNSKTKEHRINEAAVEAYIAGDFMALHEALGLFPWQPSPLPATVHVLGVDPANPRPWPLDGFEIACELQAELEAAVAARGLG